MYPESCSLTDGSKKVQWVWWPIPHGSRVPFVVVYWWQNQKMCLFTLPDKNPLERLGKLKKNNLQILPNSQHIMYQSKQSFNIHSPWATQGHLSVVHSWGVGNLTQPFWEWVLFDPYLGGVGNLNSFQWNTHGCLRYGEV